jgi:hypothetical protein
MDSPNRMDYYSRTRYQFHNHNIRNLRRKYLRHSLQRLWQQFSSLPGRSDTVSTGNTGFHHGINQCLCKRYRIDLFYFISIRCNKLYLDRTNRMDDHCRTKYKFHICHFRNNRRKYLCYRFQYLWVRFTKLPGNIYTVHTISTRYYIRTSDRLCQPNRTNLFNNGSKWSNKLYLDDSYRMDNYLWSGNYLNYTYYWNCRR